MRSVPVLLLSSILLFTIFGGSQANALIYNVVGTDEVWVSSAPCGIGPTLCPVYKPGSFTGQLDVSTNTVLTAEIVAASPFTLPNWRLLAGPSPLPNITLNNGAAAMFLTINLANNSLTGETNAPICPSQDGCGRFIMDMTGTLAATPLPATWSMMILGLCGFCYMVYRRRGGEQAA